MLDVLYLAAAGQHASAGATDNSQPMSDINNRQATATYETLDVNAQHRMNYQHLPPQRRQDHDYYNLGSSASTNDISPYAELDINRQQAPDYEPVSYTHLTLPTNREV